MEWNGSTRRFVPRPESSLSFLYNYNHTLYPGLMDVKQQETTETLRPAAMGQMNNCGNHQVEKKKRLTSEQLESLESSFQKEIKLDPDRKMKLSKELGLHPRQIAVWFQNRRARWKTKQLEHLYDSLKHEFDVVFKEKQKLQDEVKKLKAVLRDQACRRQQQVSGGYTEMSAGEETVESTSEGKTSTHHHHHHHQQQQQNIADGNCCFTLEDYNTVPAAVMAYWPAVPNYYIPNH